jgi:lipid II:glycine glycyltransferase (peptidoglycan interpeptide bridge formation enzyme)
MEIRFADGNETAAWNARILANPDKGNVFQGDEFAEQKKLGGWTPRYIVAGDLAITVLEKPVFSLGKMWYLPKGPGVSTAPQLGELLKSLQTFAAQYDVFAIKVEPELIRNDDAIKALFEFGLIPVAPIQPHFSTVLIDLKPSLDEILAAFNQKGRHALRRAERDGVTVKQVEASDENCRAFYEMFAATAKHHGFVIRDYDYQFKFWRRYVDAGLGQLFFTYHEGKLIACAFAMVFGEKSLYKDAASTSEKSVYGANHLMQWHIIQWAKEQGSKLHDLGGSPPSDKILDENHPHYGIGRFKTSFNKHVTDYVGAYDLPLKPFQYSLWTKFGERFTKRLWWRKHHESWY